ncbi:uncharacterized protein LOC144548900 isoform X2 [Carex rostrata]
MDGAAVAIAEPQPKPPRRISDAPSARNLKPRHVSAVRRWPPGCGRFPPPPPQPPTPSDQSQPPPSPPPSPPSLPLPSCSSSVSLTPTTPTSTTTNTLHSDSNAAPADSPPPPPPEGKIDNIPVTNEELLVNGATLVSDSNAVPDHANQLLESPPPPEGKIDNSPVGNGESLGNHLNQEAVEVPNENLLAEKEKGDLSNKRWMNSKVYPPPKRRAVSAIRRFPRGCGRKPDFCLGLIDPQPVEPDPLSSHEINHQENEDEIEANEQSDNADSEIEANGQIGTDEESKSKVEEFIVVEKEEQSMENFEIGVTNEKPKCELHSMDKEPLVNGATVEPDIVEGVTIDKPNSEQVTESNDGRPDAEKPNCEEPLVNGETAEPDVVEAVAIEKLNAEQVTTSNDGRSDAEIGVNVDSQQSKAIVVFSENVPEMDKNVGSTGKKKVVSRQKVLARKNTGQKLGRRRDKSEAIDPLRTCNDDNATMDPCTSEAIRLSQIRPAVSAKKSVSRSSKPCLSEGNTKKKGSRVAKKSIRPVKDDNPISSQLPNLMTLTLPPVTPFGGERQHLNARGKVKKILRLFQMVCRVLLRKEESGSGKQPQKDETETGSQSNKPKARNRNDLKAAEIVKKSDEYIDPGNPVVGHVPGVEVGDEFRYRMELHLIGLHRPLQCGIDWTKVNGIPVATSIVASGGYSDGMDGSDVLIYTGSGGQPAGRKGQRTKPEDQKLEKGNLALKNSMEMKLPVRVIHGLNTRDTGIKVVKTFTYDGLYMVEEFRQEPEKHKIDGQEYITQVFKYKLKRMPGQPELGLYVATKSKKCKIREGLCVPDISQGKEKIPICAINTIDDEKPPTFKYVTSTIYPNWYEKTPPKGCDCTGKCFSSKKCSCAAKNGGEVAFNFNGAIIQAKPLIYECGPSCRCPPSCYNRVTQNGIKFPLEIFKTESRGWGVRSLSSIPSGSFICEYVGELLRDEEAEKRDNDEYLFDIGHNYDDAALWEGLPSFIPDIGSSGGGASASEGFTIDAAEMGNVGRFINHSCTPNLYAQNVLFDHDDKRMPHVMLFAAENIPPMQEMTYHYNYTIGEVRDSMGNEKVKKCYCGSSECEGRLY